MALISFDRVTVNFPIYQMNARSLKKAIIQFGTKGKLQTTVGQKIIVRALHALSFTIHDGDRVGVLGHNGAGKSSLLRTIAGIYEPEEGGKIGDPSERVLHRENPWKE